MNQHDFIFNSVFDECFKHTGEKVYCQKVASSALKKYKRNMFKKPSDLFIQYSKEAKKEAKRREGLRSSLR